MKRLVFSVIAAGSLAGLVPACGGGGTQLNVFSTNWTDDHGASIDAVRQRLGSARPGPSTDVVVGVAGNADKLVGLPLGGGSKWTFAHRLDSRPLVTGTVVVGSGGGELFALDAAKGTKLWSRPTGGLALHGAGDDGAVTVLTLARAGDKGSTLLAVTHDGAVVRQIETDKELGTPAVVSRIAFVPWESQYVSAIDLSDGDEVGRVVLREKTSRAWTDDGTLYFGEVGVFRFDYKIREASSGGAEHVALPVRELPGTPQLMNPGAMRQLPVAGATDRIRLYARPSGVGAHPASGAPVGKLDIQDDRFYATYFRIVMGFESKRGALAWVHLHGSDVLGGAAGNGALMTCDEDGKITMLAASNGSALGEMDLGEPVKACAVQLDQFRPPVGSVPAAPSLAAQISRAVESHEPQLATGNRFLLRELATLDDELATQTLVQLAGDSRAAPQLVADARAALSSRRNGARFMIDALARHYDYLKDELRPPPVGPIAQALAAMGQKNAAPALASHLLDPADSDADVKQVAAALVALGGPSELPALKQFFGMYRATADSDDVNAAVVSAADALLKIGGKEGRAAVDHALTDAMTSAPTREGLTALVAQVDAAKPDAGAPDAPDAKEKGAKDPTAPKK